MSIVCLSWVLRHSEAKLGARLVLIALAEFAHDDGSKAFPSVETLMERSRMSKSAVRDALKRLREDGAILEVGKTKYGTKIYTVQMPVPGMAESAITGGAQAPSERADSGPNPSENHESEPSLKKRASAPVSEPVGFADWLAYHAEQTKVKVPGPSTTTRAALAKAFATLLGEGYELDDFKAVTDYRVLDPHWAPTDVGYAWCLRLAAFGERAEAGRRLREREAALAPASVDAVDWSRFDG